MTQMQTAKSNEQKEFNQFELTKHLINKLSQFDLTPSAKLVLLYLSTCYNNKKSSVYPKQKTIAKKIGISERSTVRAIDELVKAGLIIKECNYYTNRYKITSRMTAERPRNQKNFNSDNMADTTRQNDIKQYDNLAEHEQIRETKKEQDKKLLTQYAIDRGVANVEPYVNAIMKNGNYGNILKKYVDKEKAKQQAEIRLNITKNIVNQHLKDFETAESPLDFDKEKAIAYVNSMPAIFRKQGFCAEIIKKYNLIV